MKKKPRSSLLMLLFLVLCSRTRHPLKVGLSTEIARSGLIQKLAQAFTSGGGPSVELRVAAIDDVFRAAEKHQVSVTITNDAAREAEFIRHGHSRLYTKFVYDDLLILGPAADRARIRTAASVVDAFRRIAKRKSSFCSPGDFALARNHEASIWKMASISPEESKWYVACPGDAVTALREAGRLHAYTISDRSTVDALRGHLDLRVLYAGDPLLHNDYAAILVSHQARTSTDRDSEWFVEWLSSYAARQVVENFRTADGRQFFLFEKAARR